MRDFMENPVHYHDYTGPLEAAQIANATAYARVHTKLVSHIADDKRHITEEERDKWNKKADKIALEELELKMLKKADSTDIPTLVSELKNDVPYLTADSLNTRLNNLDFVTWADLKYKKYTTLEEVKEYVKEYIDQLLEEGKLH